MNHTRVSITATEDGAEVTLPGIRGLSGWTPATKAMLRHRLRGILSEGQDVLAADVSAHDSPDLVLRVNKRGGRYE